MQYKFIIDGTLPNLNDYLKAERQRLKCGGKFNTKGNIMKQEAQEKIIWAVRQQLRRLYIDKQIFINYRFYEKHGGRDKDNIAAFAMKVTQDALVKANVIENDGWKEILGFNCTFDVDKENPRIEVTLTEVEDIDGNSTRW